MYTTARTPLATPWEERVPAGYDVVVIGSGYGGAITAARLASAAWPGVAPSVCVLERGREWLPGSFPDSLGDASRAVRSPLEPLGLHDFSFGRDLGAWMGSGLGGTSLVNANVAIDADPEVFDDPHWPQAIRDLRDNGQLIQLYATARAMLRVGQHPGGAQLTKFQVLGRGVPAATGAAAALLRLAVNFDYEGDNPDGVRQRACINCGDCVTGCNVGAKNTLDTNYLAVAKSAGAHLLTQVEVRHVLPAQGGGYRVFYTRRGPGGEEQGELFAARAVVLSAGSLGSTAILLRSREQGLSVSPALGTRFSGNGDFFAVAYNSDHRADTLGWGAYPDSPRARRLQPGPGPTVVPGPSIVGAVRYGLGGPVKDRITVEDLSLPLTYVDAARATFATFAGQDTDPDSFFDNFREFVRRARDFAAVDPRLETGALNHALTFLMMGHDDAGGRIELDSVTGGPKVVWPGVGAQALFANQNAVALGHATELGATFIENPVWAFSPFRTLITAHPLGGCPMGDDPTASVVNSSGRLYDGAGALHGGIYVADGSVIPAALGVNPFLTISALAEHIAGQAIADLSGVR